jgi:ATP-dependent DNA helicase DinG
MTPEYLKNKFANFRDKTLYPQQIEAIEFFKKSTAPIVVIHAPTGSGKTGIGNCCGMLYDNYTYIVSSKPLQAQLRRDFPELKSMFGRNNFSCQQYKELSCDDCTHSIAYPCSHKKIDCLYEMQKRLVLGSKYRLLNYYYALFEMNYVGKFSGSELMICDEADLLEGLLTNFVQLYIPGTILTRLKCKVPEYKTVKSQASIDSLKQWAGEVREKTNKSIITLQKSLEHKQLTKDKTFKDDALELKSYESIRGQLDIFISNVGDTWIQERKPSYRHGINESLIFKPTWISEELSNKFFFRHGKRFLFMSATFPPKNVMGKLLGRRPGDFDYLEIDSTFKRENRRIYTACFGSLNKKRFDKDVGKIIEVINIIVDKYPNQKGIIHTVSYKLNDLIMKSRGDGRFITHTSKNRQEILNLHAESDLPLVLVSPSLTRGIDLIGDLARFCIIAKAPFLNLGDKFTSARAFSGPVGSMWYRSMCAQDIQQAAGRGVRNATDWCHTWIVDGDISDMLRKEKGLFGKYFINARWGAADDNRAVFFNLDQLREYEINA